MSPAHSVLDGQVMHARFGAVAHRFRYRLSMIALDLDDLAGAFRGRWLWSAYRLNIACILRRDHLRGGHADLAIAARDLVEQQTGERPEGRIELITQPRYLGICFNPISLFLCHGRNGDLQALIAEVHNTPWGEQHAYVLQASSASAGETTIEFDKALHVSPFMPMDIRYRLRLRRRAGQLHVGIESWRADKRVLNAQLSLRSQPLTGRSLAWLLCATPLMTLRVLAVIHWEALRLWLKRVPVVPHPGALRPGGQHAVAESSSGQQSQ